MKSVKKTPPYLSPCRFVHSGVSRGEGSGVFFVPMKKPQNSGRLPSFQFYPADWRKDPGVQSLDFETRGIWFEMICLMHESEERGVLLLNGLPMPELALGRLLGLDNQNLTNAITTLLTYGIAHRRESDGAIYNKRMVKDEALRIIRKNAGSLGGNPLLLNQKPTTEVNQKSTPSSSSSSSSSISSSDKEDKAASASKPSQQLSNPVNDNWLPSMLESEKLSGEGKFAEALATRIGMTLAQLQASVDSMNLPTGCFETYLRNRAAEDWRTRGNKPIGYSTWFADLQRFTEAFARNTGPEPKKSTPKQTAPDGWQAVYATIDADPVYSEGEYCCPDWERLSPAERSEVTRKMAAMPPESPQRGFNGSGSVRTAERQIDAAESEMGEKVTA